MVEIDADIQAYTNMQADLEANNMGKWVLIHEKELISIFDSFEDAAAEAVKKFGAGPYLIRQVGAPSVTLPASVVYKIN